MCYDGLIGKNGVGKTTVLKLILGLKTPSEGTVEIDDGVKIGYFSRSSQLNGNWTTWQATKNTPS